MVLEDRDYMRPNFGGPSGGLKVGRSPVLMLVVINLAVFIITPFARTTVAHFSLHAIDWSTPAVFQTLYGVFSYQFIHANFEHILWNMLMLFMIGRIIESDFSRFEFWRLYLGAGVVGGLTWCFISRSGLPMVGASGAISGIILAVAFIHPNKVINLFFVIPVRIKWFSLGIFLFDILMFREQQMGVSKTNEVAYLAHIGGAIGGYVMLLIYHKNMITLRWRDIIDFSSGKKGTTRTRRGRGNDPMPFPGGGASDRDDGQTVPLESDPFLKIDPILDKIGKHGMKSLTKKEKQMLDRARKKLK